MLGWIRVDVKFKEVIRNMDIFIIPSISHNIILGIDFVKTFNLMPDIIKSVDLVNEPMSNFRSSALADLSKSPSESNKGDSNYFENQFFKLTPEQQQQLNAIISLFPNFETQGLG